MAITITKRKTKAKTKVKAKSKVEQAAGVEQSALEYVREVADEAGVLADQIKTAKQKLKVLEGKYKILVDPIQKMVDEEYNPATAVHGSGKTHTCTIGGKANKTELTDPLRAYAIFEDLSDELLESVLEFSAEDIKAHLTTAEQKEVCVTERTGKRRLVFTKI